MNIYIFIYIIIKFFYNIFEYKIENKNYLKINIYFRLLNYKYKFKLFFIFNNKLRKSL